MTSNRPYLIRALYEWIVDNRCTPYLIVNAAAPAVDVPEAYVENDRIVLNVSPQAVRNLNIDGARVAFDGRFGGVSRGVSAPVSAVTMIYARETGEGMMFEVDKHSPPPTEDAGPKLRVVK